MYSSIIATFVILTSIFAILSSLGFALFYLLFAAEGSKHTSTALSWRIALSMGLFIGMIAAIHLGWITPNAPPL